MKKMETTDINRNVLEDGDSVIFSMSMKVKGTQINLKKCTKIKNIRLTDYPMEIDGKVDSSSLILKTAFVKKK